MRREPLREQYPFNLDGAVAIFIGIRMSLVDHTIDQWGGGGGGSAFLTGLSAKSRFRDAAVFFIQALIYQHKSKSLVCAKHSLIELPLEV